MRQKAFGKLLKQARLDGGWRQDEWSEKIGMSPNYCSKVERGQLISLTLFSRWWQLLQLDANEALRLVTVTVEAPRKRSFRETTSTSPNAREGEYVAFGRVLASARRQAQVTQEELARVLKCKRLHVSRVELGRQLPSMRRLAELHRILDFDANQLLAHLCDPSLGAAFYGFGRVVELARIGLSLSLEAVALHAECDLERYQAIESGHVLPSMEEVVRIHRITEFDANAALRWLWEYDAPIASDGTTD